MISDVIHDTKYTAAVLVACVAVSNCTDKKVEEVTKEVHTTNHIVVPTIISVEDKVTDSKQTDKAELGQYVYKLMDVVESPLSDAMRVVVTRAIVDVSFDIFSNQQDRKQFTVLIAIESKFNNKAKSGAGAVGITQVIPKYAKSFGEKCGFSNVTNEDIEDTNINLILGACHFRSLLDTLNSNTLALVAYNSGLYSDQLKQLKRLENISNKETASYVVKYNYIKEKVEEDKDGKRK